MNQLGVPDNHCIILTVNNYLNERKPQWWVEKIMYGHECHRKFWSIPVPGHYKPVPGPIYTSAGVSTDSIILIVILIVVISSEKNLTMTSPLEVLLNNLLLIILNFNYSTVL